VNVHLRVSTGAFSLCAIYSAQLAKQLAQLKQLYALMSNAPKGGWGAEIGVGNSGGTAVVRDEGMIRAVRNNIRNAFLKIRGHSIDRYAILSA
jgi:hypothetical protein